ncbi:hypothetical protein [Nitrobacter sp. JJSN]|jgi:hypothetical protein|uniref:hypothetical protein n=1 Tax=Nitrobacter sp. JJSN TaxID=3453033 RepID=UPI003F77694A
MSDGTAESADRIDAKTGKAVAEAIGERLRAHVRPEEAKLPVQLQLLLDQLRTQDGTPDSISGTAPVSGISNWS